MFTAVVIITFLTLQAVLFLEPSEHRARDFNVKFGGLFKDSDPKKILSIGYPLVFFVRRILVTMCFSIELMILRTTSVSFVL
jgi:hypothetical protein